MALITLANPEKNFLPSSKLLIATNSVKLAPAQNVRSPPLFKTITLMSSFLPASLIANSNCFKIGLGIALCSGVKNVI